METWSPGQGSVVGGPGGPSADEQQFEDDLRKALEESLKTQEEEEKRRKFLGYDKPDDSRDAGSTVSTRLSEDSSDFPNLRSPPDLMSFKFDHVLKKYEQSESETVKRREGTKAAGILGGRQSVGNSTSFEQTGRGTFPHSNVPLQYRHSLPITHGGAPTVIPKGQPTLQTTSEGSSWGDRLFQSNINAPKVVRNSQQSPNQRNSAIWPADTATPTVNPFNSPVAGSSRNPTKELSSGKLSSSEMMDSLLKASIDSISSSPNSESSATNARGSSFHMSNSSNNPFGSSRLSTSHHHHTAASGNNFSVTDSGNIRRISSQPSFQDFMSNGSPPQQTSTLVTVKQSRSSDDIGNEVPSSSGNNLMHFSPSGPNAEEVFDFSYFDPLKDGEKKQPSGGVPKLKTSSLGGTEAESADGETPPAVPPRRPISFALGETTAVHVKPSRPRRSSNHGGVSPTKSWVPSKLTKNVDPSKVFFGDGLYDINSLTDEEGVSFGRRVARIRREYDHVDQVTNPGHIVASVYSKALKEDFETSVKIVLYSPGSKEKPVMFTCDVNTSVQHIIIQALCYTAEGNIDCDPGKYGLKIPGRSEYLLNDMVLGHLEYVQEKRKFDQDVELVLIAQEEISVALARTLEDDETEIDITSFTSLIDTPITTTVSKRVLVPSILLSSFFFPLHKRIIYYL